MDYSNVDLKDLIDTSSVQDLFLTYPWLTSTLPSLIGDSAPLDEPVEVPPSYTMFDKPSSCLPFKTKAIKERMVVEDPTP